jgi:hypothetical protein
MKPILPILIALTLSGCVTEKKRSKICRSCPSRIETVVKDSIVRRDSIVKIQGETIYTTITAKCPDGAKPIFKYVNRYGTVGKSINTQVNDSTVVNSCVIDSNEVVIAWNENHRTVSKTETIQYSSHCYDWKDMVLSVVVSIVSVSVVAWVMGRKRQEE